MIEINLFRKAPFGKLYKTRSGKKAVFVGRKSKCFYYLIVEGSPKYQIYCEYGRRFEDNYSNELSDYDIVSEWDFTIRKEKFHIPNDLEKACEFWKDHLAGYDIFEDDIERSIESFKLAMEL